MATFNNITDVTDAKAKLANHAIEAIIVDGALVAVKAGPLRISADQKRNLVVSEEIAE